MNFDKRRRRNQDVAARAATPDPTSRRCRVVGCPNLTRAGAGNGLNRLFCRKHEDFYQRHGSPYRGSYGHQWLNPYRRAAFDWLTENADDFMVKTAIAGVEALYRNAGQMIEAFRLRGMKPQERARAAWARLREAKIDPRLPLAAWIAVEMITRDDPQAVTTVEYKRVQAAKIIHRIVSGTHKRWQRPRPDGSVAVTELHKFPMSRGRVLRHIGEDVERVAELVVAHHLDAIRAFKVVREEAGRLDRRARPEGIDGVPKRKSRATTAAVHAKAETEPAPTAISESLPKPNTPSEPYLVPEMDKTRKRPYSIKLPDGTIVTYK